MAARIAGRAAYEYTRLQPFIPTYVHLIVSALFPIYTGAHSSLSRPSSAAKPNKKTKADGTIESEDEDEPIQIMESLTPSDALVFPLLAGCTLTGLYFLIKWLGDAILLNKILNMYFAGFSVFSVARMIADGLDTLHSVLFPREYLDQSILYRVDATLKHAIPSISEDETSVGHVKVSRSSPLPGAFSRMPLPTQLRSFLWMLVTLPNQKLTIKLFVHKIVDAEIKMGIHGLEGLAVGLACVLYFNFVDSPWFLTNLMGFGFAYGALQLMTPGTFWTGTLILSGLFFYDIYFVFFTPMMVTVAKSLDIPVKLLFPRPSDPDDDSAKQQLSMLGLGDIVLPGMVIGLALRFDLFMFYLMKQKHTKAIPAADDKQDSEGLSTGTLARAQTREEVPNVTKVPFVSVAEGWGDRIWTSPLIDRVLSLLTFSPSALESLSGARLFQKQQHKARTAFPKPYFHAAIFGYILGMLVTLGAMHLSEHPQPALLYLVPGVLGSLWTTALIRGELAQMWSFSEMEDENEKQKKTPKKDGKVKDNDAAHAKETSKASQDKPEAEKAGIKGSLFSLTASEKRADKYEKAMKRYVASGEHESDQSDSDENARKADQDAPRKDHVTARKRGPRLFEFSIRLPAVSSTVPIGDQLVEDKSPRWSATEAGDNDHVGKRMRVE